MLSSQGHFNRHKSRSTVISLVPSLTYLREAFFLLPHNCLHLPEDQVLGWSCWSLGVSCLYIMDSTLHGWDLPLLGPYCDTYCENLHPDVVYIFWPWVSKPFSVESLYLFQNTFAQFILSGQNLSLLGKGKVMEYNLFHSSVKSKWQEQALC